jgi:hypothetical protein
MRCAGRARLTGALVSGDDPCFAPAAPLWEKLYLLAVLPSVQLGLAPGWDVLRWYLPMFLWPPLLLAVTWHYLRRRRISPTFAQPPTYVETTG